MRFPPPTYGLKLDDFQKIPALSDSATTNWLLTAHPDLYLFGSLVGAEMSGVNDERAPLWKARRDEILDEVEKLSNKNPRRRRDAGDGRDAVIRRRAFAESILSLRSRATRS